MSDPIGHIEDCNLNHYSLQLSLYMYIILKHNPRFEAGDLTVQHVVFEKEGVNEYGYPITRHAENGDPLLKDVVKYKVPYLKDEVLTIIKWLKT